MNANQIRASFLKFFESKQHHIVPSAPMVVKNDPTLMFTNAGMNPFKDMFLGNSPITHSRIANTQKCLRVSGKHNDLEEVGHDTYHHTMFEMLGNWSFGNYFKKEAIDWAWEYLTEVLKIDKDSLYVTVFGGDVAEKLERDNEAAELWAKHTSLDRIIDGNKKDNFWEMGDTGPCGPCSEIHVDIRNPEEKLKISGRDMVNQGHPQVIEIWNNVFMQFNRKANGDLERLPAQHVDTGMGFERLCMVVQGKQSNYDTDVFTPLLNEIARLSGINYGANIKTDIAMRVIADHLRAVSFAIADGQVPSNNKAGYVIRRILRRAVRYAYTYLNQNEPFMCKLVPALSAHMGGAFPELKAQEKLIIQVITEEENSFLRTLATGIRLLEQVIAKTKADNKTEISGKAAFELYDTFGFPLDLTELILREQNMGVNRAEFDTEMAQQKLRSRSDAAVETGDWTTVETTDSAQFVGYDHTACDIKITRYRSINTKGKTLYHLVFDKTPFYAESGGQVGDTGYIDNGNEQIEIIDTKKENTLSVHIAEKLPANLKSTFKAQVVESKRLDTASNHSATHLLHQALREVLGNHVEQKGSLVSPESLRFDFAHFQKLTDAEIKKVEELVNMRIRKNIALTENRAMPIEQATKLGAMALFGEKYGNEVRVIQFDHSVELCGGTHVSATGQIGLFKITSEGAIAAGIRRIEAITGTQMIAFINNQIDTIGQIKNTLKAQQDVVKSVETLVAENESLKKKIEALGKEKLVSIKTELETKIEKIGDINFLTAMVNVDNAGYLKDLSFQLKEQFNNVVLVLGAEVDGKANLAVTVSENLVKEKNLNAGTIVKEIAKEIEGGGGGQAFFATAGGKKVEGLQVALNLARKYVG